MFGGMFRFACIPAIALASAALIPATSHAATVSVDGNQLVLQAAPGEDSLRVEGADSGSGVQLAADSITSYPDAICDPAQWSANAVDCDLQTGGVRVIAGDGDDHVNVYSGLPASHHVTVLGGDGVDDLSAFSHGGTSTLDGGPGNDELGGGDRNDALHGGPGDDTLLGRGGDDEVRGGDGADTLRGDDNGSPGADVVDGGAGADMVDLDWSSGQPSNQPYVSVTLDGQANDGRPADGDNVTAVEKIHLTYAATLAAAGDPVDFEVFNSGNGGSRLVGSPGADRLRSYDDRDTIEAGAGDDWIETGYGDDTIDPGPGRDTVNAEAGSGSCNFLVCRIGSGNDTINARDGEADSIDCGVGTDVARVDAVDTVAGCETVETAGNGGPGGPGPGGPGGPGGPETPGGAQACTVPRVKAKVKQSVAVKRVRSAGCKAKVVKTKSRTIKKGLVVKVSPKAGKRLKSGATVKVYVSKGRR
jgi:Ca2+-binding RTX toxin-like protein